MAIIRKEKNTKNIHKNKPEEQKRFKGRKEVEIKPFSDAEEAPKKKKEEYKKTDIVKRKHNEINKKTVNGEKKTQTRSGEKHTQIKKSSRDQKIHSKFEKRSNEKVERGPTKKELREELNRKGKKAKKPTNENLDKSEKKNVDKKQNGKEVKSDKKKFKKEKKPRPTKQKIEKSKKLIFTTENINSCLLEAKNSKDKVTNMLLFVLKQFKSTPAEVLAKVKILTSDKKIETDNDCIELAVLKHISVYYGLNGTPIQNLFTLIATDSLISKYLLNFVFSASFKNDQYNFFFEEIFNELAKMSSKTGEMSFTDFLGSFYEIDTNEKFDEEVANTLKGESKFDDDLINNEDSKINEDEKCESETPEISKTKENVQLNDKVLGSKNAESSDSSLKSKDDESSASSIDLVSLTDDNEINRLDTELGKMFSKGLLTVEEQKYYENILKCLELLIKNNSNIKIDNLIRILYLTQFECIAPNVKFIVKDFLAKIGDKKRVFKIFQVCSLASPSVYPLYSIFFTYCSKDFDLLKFLSWAFAFEHEDLILNKIDNDAFYAVYNSELGKPFDDCLVALIKKDRREEKLKELNEMYFNENIKSVIQETLKNISDKTASANSKKHLTVESKN